MSPIAATNPAATVRLTAGYRDQPLDRCIVERTLGNLLIKHAKVITQPVQFAKMAFDRGLLVIRYRLAAEPSTTEVPE